MNKKKTLCIIMICTASILLIAGIIGFQKISNLTNPHKAFEKDLKKPEDLYNHERKYAQRQIELEEQKEQGEEQQKEKLEELSFNKNVINLLLLGVDSSEERESRKKGYRSDSIIVVSVNIDTTKVKMLSIPRDSYTDIPGNKNKDKINHAMAFGGGPKKKGNQYAVEAVEGLLGIDVHYYITVDMDSVKSIVDTIGGVTIDVERDMDLGEEVLKKGEQKLNGDQALIYIRNRDVPAGDFARISQQHKFMMALFNQIKENGKLSDVIPLYLKMKDKIFTDLKLDQIGALALLLKALDSDTIETFTLKGKGIKINGIYYLDIDRAHMESIINEHF
ncbi:LCP family protein [Proteiniborus sp. MB09-C3]|uniref:LCP family protein n=1 Tax=Proteiniborus sp. MB09-C3 TaxID=3050072 RepID=UPI0025557D08|nr:LCP family protein [Proteiniborus sp. MB09-C3]WIV12073.1 LCP family protein [Proteiniborus sp. MB09-C3]